MSVIKVYRRIRHSVHHCTRVAFAWALSPATFRPFQNLLTGNILLTADDALFIRYIFIFLYLLHHIIHSFLSYRNTTQELLFQIDLLLSSRLFHRNIHRTVLRTVLLFDRSCRNIYAFVTGHLYRFSYAQALGTIVIRS